MNFKVDQNLPIDISHWHSLGRVPLGRVYSSTEQDSPLDEEVLSNIECTWAPASKQFPLLHMGKEVKVVTAIYDNRK